MSHQIEQLEKQIEKLQNLRDLYLGCMVRGARPIKVPKGVYPDIEFAKIEDDIEWGMVELLLSGFHAPTDWLAVRVVGDLAFIDDTEDDHDVWEEQGVDVAGLERIADEIQAEILRLNVAAFQTELGQANVGGDGSQASQMVAADDGGKALTLTDADLDILKVLDQRQTRTPAYLLHVPSMGERKTGQRLGVLEAHGLVNRDEGMKSGYAISGSGRRIVAEYLQKKCTT